METVKSWFFKAKGGMGVKETEAGPGGDKGPETSGDPTPTQVERNIDANVAEFFKDLPEPYRTKAIDRFSSREGFFKVDFIRDMAMRNELFSARRGNFLEDKRELARKQAEQEEEEIEISKAKYKEAYRNREIPAWEKAVRARIPVHEDESAGLKLFQVANLMFVGGLLLFTGVTLKKRRPGTPTWQYYMTVVGTSYLFVYFQTASVYRLMDWGPFDRSIDNRDAVTKMVEEIQENFTSLPEKFLEWGKKNDS